MILSIFTHYFMKINFAAQDYLHSSQDQPKLCVGDFMTIEFILLPVTRKSFQVVDKLQDYC